MANDVVVRVAEQEYITANNVVVTVPEQQFIRGEDGFDPEVTISEIDLGHRVTITDREHPVEGQSFDVLDGEDGSAGTNGATFIPSVDSAGNISWTNNGDLPNPEPRNIRGPKGEKLTYADLTAADKADLVQGPIADAQTAAVNAVNSKGEEVLQSIPSDYTELSDDVDDLKSHLSSLVEDVNSQSIWSQGSLGVGSSGGNIVENEKAITTTNMITDNVSVALVDNTCKFSIAVYSSADAWLGFLRYENDTYSLNYYTGTNFTEISYSEIASAYPSCKIRIMVQKVSTSATITPSEYAAVSITKTSIPSPYDASPAMDGTASPGVSGNFARGDHVHPSDTSKADKTSYVTLSGTVVTQTGADNTMYLCGELAELTFTAPATGQTAIRFSSGTTPTVVTLTGITMPDDWAGAEASKTYEINVLNGYGVWQSWT